jgi:hypothetical protein
MDPRQLFPVLVLVFALLALVGRWRRGRWRGPPFTWGLLAFVFALVSVWLRMT